ncbi:hypothetical protein [Rhizosphaericola mali]|uniref:Uncharacterized protein n=1 Tax=Rhizosphaericola mali TaxID=2545455 RepID=A0A5P2FWN0_9BACT|nr:hypothetical protein [Rhizosphaericola mali]QES87585.1 hypothetical protein E0W69_002515 [Rhizosphaericola mali]
MSYSVGNTKTISDYYTLYDEDNDVDNSSMRETNHEVQDNSNKIEQKLLDINHLPSYYTQIEGDDRDIELTPMTIQNAANLFNNLPEDIKDKLKYENVTKSEYGTINFDWFNEDDGHFSLEIGDNALGFYLNTPSKTIVKNNLRIDSANVRIILVNLISELYKEELAFRD